MREHKHFRCTKYDLEMHKDTSNNKKSVKNDKLLNLMTITFILLLPIVPIWDIQTCLADGFTSNSTQKLICDIFYELFML